MRQRGRKSAQRRLLLRVRVWVGNIEDPLVRPKYKRMSAEYTQVLGQVNLQGHVGFLRVRVRRWLPNAEKR